LFFIPSLKSNPKYIVSITYSDFKSGWCFIIYKALYLFGPNNSYYLSWWSLIVSNIPRSAKLILTLISHVGYLSPSKGKFIDSSRHYSYHRLTKYCIRIFMIILWHTPNSQKNCVWCDFSYWVQQAQLPCVVYCNQRFQHL
jgi:hypothetical protein